MAMPSHASAAGRGLAFALLYRGGVSRGGAFLVIFGEIPYADGDDDKYPGDFSHEWPVSDCRIFGNFILKNPLCHHLTTHFGVIESPWLVTYRQQLSPLDR